MRTPSAKSAVSKTPLRKSTIVAFIGTSNARRAKTFYRDRLGLTLKSEDQFALVFDVDGTMLRVTPVKHVAAATYTVLGWRVPDVLQVVAQLTRAGIRFERYAGMPQDEHGIWIAPSGAKVAWLKDPDGNLLSLTQF